MSTESSFLNKRYDVFLSFRGPDTREGFVKKLYPELDKAGINVFLDRTGLKRGEHINSSLQKAIRESRICIPIFSQNFAQSKWCLTEVSDMVEYKVNILPLFYDVLPSDLRYPDTGKFAEDFKKYYIQEISSTELIEKWKSALKTVSDLCGWSLQDYSGETALIQGVLKDVTNSLHKMKKMCLDIPECFGLDWSVEHVKRLLSVGNDDKKMVKIGIHGMGGIGKTTLAKVVYKLVCSEFEAACFVLDVGERDQDQQNGLAKLQEQMLKDLSQFNCEVYHVDRGRSLIQDCLVSKTVLLLLDGIETSEQLEALGGSYSNFGAGSRLLITSRNRQILKAANVDEEYEVRKLQHKDALQLFSYHAFPHSRHPPQDLETPCNNIVSACEGLPLALKFLGESLVGELDKNVWADMVEKVRCEPYIQGKLKACYEKLDSYEKEIFQDIACFFTWTDREMAIIFWEEMRWSSHASLRYLFLKSLISFGPTNELLMHSCLRDLGRSLAKEISIDPRKRTRLFEEEDVQHVLWRQWEKAAKVRYLCYEPKQQETLDAQMFKSLYNLQLLWLTDVVVEGQFSEAHFQDLRWLRWRRCSSKSLPSRMNLNHLVILQLIDGQVTRLWDERSEENMRPQKLKVLTVSGCVSLECLPATLIYSQLQFLDLRNCKSLRSLPNTMGNIRSLVSLNMEGCGVSILPDDFGELSCLQELNLSRCKNLRKLPASFGNLIQLQELRIDHNPHLTELPESFAGLKALLYLNAGYCQLSDNGVPVGICELSSLKIMHLEHNRFSRLPQGLKKLRELWELHLDGCKELSTLPQLPSSLEMLYIRGCSGLHELSCMWDLQRLMTLDASNSPHLGKLPGVESLKGLTTLNFVGCKNISTGLLERSLGMGGLQSLKSLFIGGPGISTIQLQSIYDSIKVMAWDKQCLLPSAVNSSKWVNAEANGRNGSEEKECMDYTTENNVNCGGYVVTCLTFGGALPKNEDRECASKDGEEDYSCSKLASRNRMKYTVERDGKWSPCVVRHPQTWKDDDMLEVRIVRVEESGFEWLRMGNKLKVNADSDYDNWEACFNFLVYETVDAISPSAGAKPPREIIFGVN